MTVPIDNNNLNIDTDIDIPASLSLTENSIGSVIPAPKPTKPYLGKIMRQRRRARMEAAFELWKTTGSFDPLLRVVIEYTQDKLKTLEYDEGFKGFGTAETVDDWSQKVSIKIWESLSEGKFRGATFASFLTYLNVACKNREIDAFNDLDEERGTKVRLMKPIKDPYGGNTGEEQDNPVLYAGMDSGYGGGITLPSDLGRVDLNICKLIWAGMNYARIAKELQMTEAAITQRVSRMRKHRVEDKVREREAARAKRQADLHEQKTSCAKGLAEILKMKAARLTTTK